MVAGRFLKRSYNWSVLAGCTKIDGPTGDECVAGGGLGVAGGVLLLSERVLLRV